MHYNIIYPTVQQINGDSINEAIKNYVKFYQDMNLTKLIIQDRNKYYNSIINYYKKNGQNKIQINTFPGYNPLITPNHFLANQILPNQILPNQQVLSLAPLATLL